MCCPQQGQAPRGSAVAQQSWWEGGGLVSPAHSPSLLSHPCPPFPLGSPAVKDWQQHSLGPTTSVAPPPGGLAVALCRLQDPFTTCSPVQYSLFAVLLWFSLSLPHLCPQHVPPLALAAGARHGPAESHVRAGVQGCCQQGGAGVGQSGGSRSWSWCLLPSFLAWRGAWSRDVLAAHPPPCPVERRPAAVGA